MGDGNIVRCRTGLLGDRQDAIGWHVDKSGVGIDEAANQPGTGDAVDNIGGSCCLAGDHLSPIGGSSTPFNGNSPSRRNSTIFRDTHTS